MESTGSPTGFPFGEKKVGIPYAFEKPSKQLQATIVAQTVSMQRPSYLGAYFVLGFGYANLGAQ